ncbi:hypothetical protein FJT64_008412 [Amphibalanus amphitrite]|uniref:Uncharacterized protein n=1 Tax=Amphibalanus amphitrite TaxID=1232801 RepID=A0A6A4VWV9_AMPAM|nr:hypothetical protein FJT64_008412 [Amphibalanus amphitrite]
MLTLLLLAISPGPAYSQGCAGPADGQTLICYTESWSPVEEASTCGCSHLVLPPIQLDDTFSVIVCTSARPSIGPS